MKGRTDYFNGLQPFEISIRYVDIYADSPENVHNDHIHEECEIYPSLPKKIIND